ncbi:MAG: transcriptional regulator [Owenweeksia sp.]|nr:transcriptional regulator [Owenweeksia sp.]
MLPEFDPLLHSELRLKIVSLLVGLNSAEFTHILNETGATRGNVSVQLRKLRDADYIMIDKTFGSSYPVTTCKITDKGLKAFEDYVEAISTYLKLRE